MASRFRIRIVLDWDGTLTTRDTLHVVAAIGYRTNKHRVPPPPSWDQIVQAYMADYTCHQDAYRPSRQDRRTIPLESAWLASLRGVEVRSVRRVVDAGIFADVTEGDISMEAEGAVRNGEVRLREGWWDVLTAASPGAGACHSHSHSHVECDASVPVPAAAGSPPIAIISVNWSAAFIRACLTAAATTAPTEAGDLKHEHSSQIQATVVKSLPILANNLLPCSPRDNDYSTTVAPAGGAGIHTSADKLAALQHLQRLHRTRDREDQGESESQGDIVIYVGDSPTDFDCLVSADVGVCVRDEPLGSGQRELQETLERVGVEVRRLDLGEWVRYRRESSRQERGEAGGGCGGGEARVGGDNKKVVVWWVADLREVARFVDAYGRYDRDVT
ncbi:hypothetical protein AYO21_02815 [Fonsecaea monophora]|uniref:Uncharacterized protein n=1 Tax=Fonsecaea monophora TaxID=254056 RepID=A0A177FF03_9EURO|nr:hypothetical protein AYO21_02815 [Fonsecaea monophora]OAG42864.1 hypothetical protein AYO21_02815 [Fonsecaea monophora]